MSEVGGNRKRQAEPHVLETRHAFLDTQVYRKLRHNPANRALKLLAEQIAARRLVLHTTDITLNEVSRQIAEDVEQSRLAVSKLRKDIDRWRHTVPGIATLPELDAGTAATLFKAFRRASKDEWRAREHRATEHPAASVFADYFARLPPFDMPGSKEFPDAFVLKTLEAWCAARGEIMYVVTLDAAVLRYVAASEWLLPLETIEELLAAAEASAECDDGDAEAVADALLNTPEFDCRFEQALEPLVDKLALIYCGDLPEGEANGATFGGTIHFLDYQIVSRTSRRIGLLVNADVELDVDVSFENRRYAGYDREDDIWIGGELDSATVRSDITLELYMEMEVATGEIVDAEPIRNEYTVG
ncbi:MAG: DUF4935 domain-containing protein [Rhizorhabdus sp.]|uniref:PIN domain-containing protein n=1 Tax=Rhizorhabdus sp. TaxID=1968843 RepID=UPI001B417817|nr:PIN domain-containing protein [Rhizorhabdus sp.]MBP8234696.1 DUF4935 domain-containing protein [Rhizorhabdus sp.]